MPVSVKAGEGGVDGAGRKRSISMGQDEWLVPEGLRGSGVCLGATDNVFLCFF